MIKKSFYFLLNKKNEKKFNHKFFLKLQIALISLLIIEPKCFFAILSILYKFQKNQLINRNSIYFDLTSTDFSKKKKNFLLLFFFIIKNLKKSYLLEISQKINDLKTIDFKINFQFNTSSISDKRLIENYTYYINFYLISFDLNFFIDEKHKYLSLTSQKMLLLNYSYFLKQYSFQCLNDLLNV